MSAFVFHWFRLPDDVGTGTPGRVLPSDWSANFSSHGKPPVLSLSHMVTKLEFALQAKRLGDSWKMQFKEFWSDTKGTLGVYMGLQNPLELHICSDFKA